MSSKILNAAIIVGSGTGERFAKSCKTQQLFHAEENDVIQNSHYNLHHDKNNNHYYSNNLKLDPINVLPKQYAFIDHRSVIEFTIQRFLEHPLIDIVQVVINNSHIALYNACNIHTHINANKLLPYTIGGNTRQESVKIGLKSLYELHPSIVLIHDAVRPMITSDIISNIILKLNLGNDAVDLVLPVNDTIKSINNNVPLSTLISQNKDSDINCLYRQKLYATQTPQGFKYTTIYELHNKNHNNNDITKSNNDQYTDDISLCLDAGIKIALVLGDTNNSKITTFGDLDYMKYKIQKDTAF